MTIYVSIPVHEDVAVIVNQCLNIIKYLQPKIVLHISKRANFEKGKLLETLQKVGIDDYVYLNPNSEETYWGGIIKAHLSNIEYISRLEKGKDAKVIFHASNDMMIKQGLQEYLEDKSNLYHQRIYDQSGFWWPSGVALEDDKFIQSIARNGGVRLVASQIEGSMYSLELLKEIRKIILKDKLLESDRFYAREEIYFSTFATALGMKSDGNPYLFSEIHRFDSWIWPIWRKNKMIFPERFANILNRIINEIVFRTRLYKITRQDVERIRGGILKRILIEDGGRIWEPYRSAEEIFAVKRVPRKENDKLRKFITRLN